MSWKSLIFGLIEAAEIIGLRWDTEHFKPQPGMAWKFSHFPVISPFMVFFTNLTIAKGKKSKLNDNIQCN